MPKTAKLPQKKKNLIRRYLIWCYKTTKEALDRTDRYFTQLQVDNFVFKELTLSKDYTSAKANSKYKILVDDFRMYMDKKHTLLNADYQYLQNRFAAIEKAICHFLGSNELGRIRVLYETEMTRRILSHRNRA